MDNYILFTGVCEELVLIFYETYLVVDVKELDIASSCAHLSLQMVGRQTM